MHAESSGGAAQFNFTNCTQYLAPGQRRVADLAHFDARAVGRILGERPTRPEGLIVGMGENGEQSGIHAVSPWCSSDNQRCDHSASASSTGPRASPFSDKRYSI